MSYIEDIQNRRNQVRNNIAKGFGCEFVKAQDDELGEIEKAVYADTPQNRKLGRVGQEYHRGRKKQNIGDNEQKEQKEGGGIISGNKFSDLMAGDFDWDSDAGNKLLNYLDKHNLTDKLSNSKTQAQAFDNLSDKHKKAISEIISPNKNGGEVKKKMSKKELEASYRKAARSAPQHNEHADYYKHHYESFKKHQELGGYKKVSAYANNIMTTPRAHMRFKEYANAREKGMSHEEAAKRAHLDMD